MYADNGSVTRSRSSSVPFCKWIDFHRQVYDLSGNKNDSNADMSDNPVARGRAGMLMKLAISLSAERGSVLELTNLLHRV